MPYALFAVILTAIGTTFMQIALSGHPALLLVAIPVCFAAGMLAGEADSRAN